MQTIETRYLPATNTRSARVKATHSGSSTSVTSSIESFADMTDDQIHAHIACDLMQKLNWVGTMIGGHTKTGMVWVFANNDKSNCTSPTFSRTEREL